MNALAAALADDFHREAVPALERLELAAAVVRGCPNTYTCREAYGAALALLAVVEGWRVLAPPTPPLTARQRELWDAGLKYARFARLVEAAGWGAVSGPEFADATRAAYVIGALIDLPGHVAP